MRRVRRLLLNCGWVYLCFVAVIALLQRKLLYFPTREPEHVLLARAETFGFEPWRGAEGGIIGWTKRPGPGGDAARNLVVFHGNAGHALHREDYAHAFENLGGRSQWKVWLFEYPGYGARAGSPGRESFADAGRTAIAQLRARDSRPVYLLGESLGTGVAADLAADQSTGVAGLVLVTPFARLTDVAQMHFPFLPVKWILRDRWDNVAALAGFGGPKAVIIAGRDEVLGAAQGETLFEKIPEPKRRWLFPDATHNDPEIHGAGWAAEVSTFLFAPAGIKP
ncbi:MAG: alpha/beta fold hydrolase [Chthoniobacteraceae bacterium]